MSIRFLIKKASRNVLAHSIRMQPLVQKAKCITGQHTWSGGEPTNKMIHTPEDTGADAIIFAVQKCVTCSWGKQLRHMDEPSFAGLDGNWQIASAALERAFVRGEFKCEPLNPGTTSAGNQDTSGFRLPKLIAR